MGSVTETPFWATIEPRDVTLATERNERLIEEWLEDLAALRRAESTVTSYRSDVRFASRLFASMGRDFTQVDRASLKRFHAMIEVNDAGRERRLSRLKGIYAALASMMDYLEDEGIIEDNVLPRFRRRYLRVYKERDQDTTRRQCPSAEKIAELVYTQKEPQIHAFCMLLAKTGIRRGEAHLMDVQDIDFARQEIRLKPRRKRTNLRIPFDHECAEALRDHLRVRRLMLFGGDTDALWVNRNGRRADKNTLLRWVNRAAQEVDLHDPTTDRLALDKRFGPHNFRHWFTTTLRRAGCPERVLIELRGDARTETRDRYDHVEDDEMRQHYLAAMPELRRLWQG